MEHRLLSVWFEAREQSKFLKYPVDIVFHVDLHGEAPPRAEVEFRGNFGGSNSAPIELEKLDELSQTIDLFVQSKPMLDGQGKESHKMLKADLGLIKANCVRHKTTVIIIQHPGGTIERELNGNLVKEIREFIDDVKKRLARIGKK